MADLDCGQDNLTGCNVSIPWFNMNESTSQNKSLSLPEMSSTLPVAAQSALIFFYGTATLLSLVGNSMVVLVLTRDALKRTNLNVYLINLALADITMAVFCMPFSFTEVMLQGWIFGDVLCPVMRFSQQTSVLVSIFILVTIGVDRYYGVVHPLKPRVTKTRSRLIVLSIWLVSSGLAIPQLAISRQAIYSDGNRCEETWPDKYKFGYTIAFMIVSYAFPVLVLCVTYVMIGMRLWVEAHTDLGRVDHNNQARQRKKIIKMLCTVVSMFVVSWLPLHVFRFILDLHPSFVFNNPERAYIFFFCAHWLAMSHSFMNPIVYSFMNDRFRVQLCSILRRILACRSAHQLPTSHRRHRKMVGIEMKELKNPSDDTYGSGSQLQLPTGSRRASLSENRGTTRRNTSPVLETIVEDDCSKGRKETT